jgi:hypothetical protein
MDNWILIPLGVVALCVLGFFAVRYIKSLERRDTIRSLMGQRYAEESLFDGSQQDEFDDSSRESEDEVLARASQKKGSGKKRAPTHDCRS